MNDREKAVKRRYEAEGWTAIRVGAPDFLMARDGKVVAVEVKAPTDRLRPSQQTVADVILKNGIEYVVEVPDYGLLFAKQPQSPPGPADLRELKRVVAGLKGGERAQRFLEAFPDTIPGRDLDDMLRALIGILPRGDGGRVQ